MREDWFLSVPCHRSMKNMSSESTKASNPQLPSTPANAHHTGITDQPHGDHDTFFALIRNNPFTVVDLMWYEFSGCAKSAWVLAKSLSK